MNRRTFQNECDFCQRKVTSTLVLSTCVSYHRACEICYCSLVNIGDGCILCPYPRNKTRQDLKKISKLATPKIHPKTNANHKKGFLKTNTMSLKTIKKNLPYTCLIRSRENVINPAKSIRIRSSINFVVSDKFVIPFPSYRWRLNKNVFELPSSVNIGSSPIPLFSADQIQASVKDLLPKPLNTISIQSTRKTASSSSIVDQEYNKLFGKFATPFQNKRERASRINRLTPKEKKKIGHIALKMTYANRTKNNIVNISDVKKCNNILNTTSSDTTDGSSRSRRRRRRRRKRNKSALVEGILNMPDTSRDNRNINSKNGIHVVKEGNKVLNTIPNNVTGGSTHSRQRQYVKYEDQKQNQMKDLVLLWFRNDLRIEDNSALNEAIASSLPILPVFIWSPEDDGNWALGGCTRLWLSISLEKLDKSLKRKYGISMVWRRGPAIRELLRLYSELKNHGIRIRAVYCNTVYEPWLINRDNAIHVALLKLQVPMVGLCSNVLYEPWHSKADQGPGIHHGYGSVRWWLCGCKDLGAPSDAISSPLASDIAKMEFVLPSDIHKLSLSSLKIHKNPIRINHRMSTDGKSYYIQKEERDWTIGIRSSWEIGEKGAQKALRSFLDEGVYHFESRERFRADKRWTARISPYMKFGELGPRQILTALKKRKMTGRKTFIRRFAWRDTAYFMLWKFPGMTDRSIRPQYDHQDWNYNENNILAWKCGQTGYPLVDASMRQLWIVGWTPNYMRHICAGFLIQHLNVDWRIGLRWYHDTLVDADIAINANMWQNGGYCGIDPWNFVMHPVNAVKSVDPQGAYVAKWCPELCHLPPQYRSCPWVAPMATLVQAGVKLGKNYPKRIVKDLSRARKISKAGVSKVREGPGKTYINRHGTEMIYLPDGRRCRLITRNYEDYFQTPDLEIEKRKDRRWKDPYQQAMRISIENYNRRIENEDYL